MASEAQNKYIADLAVLKTKEFKEVKEMLLASGIVGENATLVKSAESIAEINHALTDLQASQFIDLLIKTKEPARGTAYSKRRVETAATILNDIKADIQDWTF